MSSDQVQEMDPCFVFAKTLDGEGGGSEGRDPTRPDGHWLHIDYSQGDARGILASEGLEEAVVDGLTRPDTRPRALITRKGVLLVLRCVNTNPGHDPEDMVSLRIWLESTRMITVRQRKLMAVQNLRDALDAGEGPRTLNDLFVELVENSANRIGAFVDQIEERVEECEEQVDSQDLMTLRPRLSRLRRQTAVVRRFVAPMREALGSLDRSARGELDEEISRAIHEQSDRITRFVEDLDLVREKTLVVQEELNNRIAQDQNARMYLLSIVAAIFLPITFISGVFGMNVAGLPGLDDPNAFLVVCGIMIAISSIVLLLLRLKRWF